MSGLLHETQGVPYKYESIPTSDQESVILVSDKKEILNPKVKYWKYLVITIVTLQMVVLPYGWLGRFVIGATGISAS
jgi:hypothetical protein